MGRTFRIAARPSPVTSISPPSILVALKPSGLQAGGTLRIATATDNAQASLFRAPIARPLLLVANPLAAAHLQKLVARSPLPPPIFATPSYPLRGIREIEKNIAELDPYRRCQGRKAAAAPV